MNLNDRIQALDGLKQILEVNDETQQSIYHQAYLDNKWFVVENIQKALKQILEHYLDKLKLEDWIASYNIIEKTPKVVGLILAGNIPFVGFHDVLCCFISGHISKIKCSDKDKKLMPYIISQLISVDARAAEYFEFIERLSDYDAVIATGSNNSAIHFEYYFRDHPTIIRRNRNGIAVLNGSETKEDLRNLAEDVFAYFGLGCRNISKIFVPTDYTFDPLMEILHEHNELVLHNKYKNNFDYNYAIYLLNKDHFYSNGCIVLKESEKIPSRIASLNYEYYTEIDDLEELLLEQNDEIQCMVSNVKLKKMKSIPFGSTQSPSLSDYADGIDTLSFLSKL